jgi:hypothetical protein
MNGDVAAVIEGLLETFAEFFFARRFPHASLQIFVPEARNYF